MSNIVLKELVTKQKFSSINEVASDIRMSKNPLILVDDLTDIMSAISVLESISNTYNIDVLVQYQSAYEESAINMNVDVLNIFDEIKEDIFEKISNSDLVLYLGKDIERFQDVLLEEDIKTYQITYRNSTNTLDESVVQNSFYQVNSNESGFLKALLIMM